MKLLLKFLAWTAFSVSNDMREREVYLFWKVHYNLYLTEMIVHKIVCTDDEQMSLKEKPRHRKIIKHQIILLLSLSTRDKLSF